MSETNPADPNETLPPALASVQFRPLFVMRLAVRPPIIVGARRRIGVLSGGTFAGERLSGEVMEGGSDWQAIREDGAMTLDVRASLKTSDGAVICMNYRGIRHGQPDIIAKIERGESTDPSTYYFRTSLVFETADHRYDWLNRILAIGLGHRRADGPLYSVFEIL